MANPCVREDARSNLDAQADCGPLNQGLTRRRLVIGAASTALLAGTGTVAGACGAARPSPLPVRRTSALPRPQPGTAVPFEQTLARRRSRREFTNQKLTELQVARLLWAAQGVTAEWGGRTSPSAGALYPLELYVVTPDAYGHYLPRGHRFEVLAEQDLRGQVAAAALGQGAVRSAPLTIVIAAVYGRTTKKYGSRGRRYVELEGGHVAQNVLLQAVALGLAAVPIGAFEDERLAHVLRLSNDQTPLYIIAVGHP